MTLLRHVVTLLCAAALSGCETHPRVEEYSAPAAACCSSLSALPFQPMPLGQELEVSLTPAGPTYDFSGKRQHVAALKIPDGFSATTVQVRTYLSGIFIWNMSALIPGFVFLDNGTPGRVNPAAVGDFSLRIFGERQG